MYTANENDDKLLREMTDAELVAIVANNGHTIRRRRYINEAHKKYLEQRVTECEGELNRRKEEVSS